MGVARCTGDCSWRGNTGAVAKNSGNTSIQLSRGPKTLERGLQLAIKRQGTHAGTAWAELVGSFGERAHSCRVPAGHRSLGEGGGKR